MLKLPIDTSSAFRRLPAPCLPSGGLRRRSLPVCRASAFGVPNDAFRGVPDLLPNSPALPGQTVKAKWGAVSLAFLGDSVWELYIRRCFFFPPVRTADYYEKVVNEVNAESQARYLEQLLAGPVLTEEERDVIRWGKNAKITIPKRFSKSGSHTKTYRASTALECLIGFLYLTDMQRLQELMAYIGFGIKPAVSQGSPAASEAVPSNVA